MSLDSGDLASLGDKICFTDLMAAVQREADQLTQSVVNQIIVWWYSNYGGDQRVAADKTGMDVIVGGHLIPFYLTALIVPRGLILQ